jgi:phosphoserine phosphatase RsbU/P
MTDPLNPDDQRLAKVRKLTEVSRALTYAVSLDEVLALTVERAVELLDTDKALLMLTNSEGLLAVRASCGLDKAATERFREPLDETLIRRLQGLLQVDPEGFLGVPLVVSGEVTGILAVASRWADDGREDQEWLLAALADQAAVALEKTRLAAAAQFRERVIGIVSHDLRNPINAIYLSAKTLLLQEGLEDRSRRIALRIEASAERAGRMVRDLLDYTRAHLGSRIPVERRPTDLRAVLHQTVEEARTSHPGRRIDVHENGDLEGVWDADRLAQVVGNLLSNALDYSPPETPVRLVAQGEDDWVGLSVHNQGDPIPAEHLPSIFEPMQRAVDETYTSRSVGLGLYIVKHLVEAHGGTVAVDTAKAEGTTFSVRLPRHQASR